MDRMERFAWDESSAQEAYSPPDESLSNDLEAPLSADTSLLNSMETIIDTGYISSTDLSSIDAFFEKYFFRNLTDEESIACVRLREQLGNIAIQQMIREAHALSSDHASILLSSCDSEQEIYRWLYTLQTESAEVYAAQKQTLVAYFNALQAEENILGDIQRFCFSFDTVIWDNPEVQNACRTFFDRLLQAGKMELALDICKQLPDFFHILPPNIGQTSRVVLEKELWLKEMFEQKYGVAKLCASYESILKTAESKEEVEEFFRERSGTLPPYVRGAIESAVGRFFLNQHRNRTNVQELQKTVDINNPQELGAYLFTHVTSGTQQRSGIECRFEEAYLIMNFSNQGDYAAFLDKTEDIPGGTYHRSVNIHISQKPLRVLEFQVICVNGELNQRHSWRQRVARHERRHFFNDTFDIGEIEKLYNTNPWQIQRKGLKETLETGRRYEQERWTSFKQAAIAVKDELLAYLDEGTEPMDIVDILQGSMYKHIFSDLDDTQRVFILDTLKKITTILDSSDELCLRFRASEEARTICTYMLLDVPLERMPDFLEALSTYLVQKKIPLLQRRQREDLAHRSRVAAQRTEALLQDYERGIDPGKMRSKR